jgi:ATP-binding cassette, subfamily A (ABC1), member 3
MSIMGMSMFTYYFTWFIRYFITYLIVHIPASVFVWHSLIYVPIYIPLITFLLFDIVLIVQSFFIQVFFTRAKIGVVIALLFFLGQFIISFVVSNSDNPT